MKSRNTACLVALAILVLAAPALAQAPQASEEQSAEEHSVLYPRFRIGVGAFAAFFNTNLRLDSEELGIGTEIDLEDDLGFDTRKFDFRAFGFYRLGRRHRLDFGYFSLSRNSTAVLDEEIQFGDEIFPVDAEVQADFRTSFAELGYRFSFVAHRKVEVAAAIALSAMFTRSAITAVGTVGEGELDSQSEDTNVTLPIATFGLDAAWNPVSRLLVRGAVGGLYVKISDIKAAVGNIGLTAEYFLIPNFGVGAGFNWTKLGAEKEEANSIDVTYRYSGLLIYAIGAAF